MPTLDERILGMLSELPDGESLAEGSIKHAMGCDTVAAWRALDRLVSAGKVGRKGNRYWEVRPKRYGQTKVAKIQSAFNALRAACRAEGTGNIQAALDRVEPWLDYVFQEARK